MNVSALDFSILWPALVAGLLVAATHVPLGMQVLERGIVFIDLAIAQIAGLGVIAADHLGLEAHGWAVQICALSASLAGALLLTWTERKWPEVQEAVIGVVFVLAASGALLLLAANPHGGEHLKDLLVGQILWVSTGWLAAAGIVYAALLGIWFTAARAGRPVGRIVFYIVFALAVTLSVQLVGLYLVFTTLIVPALAVRTMTKHRLAWGYAVAAVGYGLGLFASTLFDLPSGPTVVWMMSGIAIAVFALAPKPSRAAARV